ncbi:MULTISPECIES: FliM/FliN family flagellar motor C-terminal domain-containing protein [unclassified Schlesneria]|uniref:FliM/FliN family flagellar motor C-terminal domain-containing protein n=1 Tax=Schlesneria TaxID=656899 RepID=UPI002F236EAC
MSTLTPANGQNRINALSVPVSVVVCEKVVKLEQLLQWSPGDILTFDKSPSSELSLQIGHRQVASGRAVTVGNHAAIRLVNVSDSRSSVR